MESPETSASPVARWIVFALVAGMALVALIRFGDDLSLRGLAGRETALRTFKSAHPLLVIGVAFLVYVTITGLSLPFATALTLVYGWFLGFWSGLLVVSFASTAGSTLAFLLSRYLLRESVERRFGARLHGFNEALQREGAFYLFTLRLVPAPFFIINLVMGLTPMRASTFWWVSQVGMLPGTAVYVYAGAQFPSLAELAKRGPSGMLTPQLIAAFAALGLFLWVAKRLVDQYRRSAAP